MENAPHNDLAKAHIRLEAGAEASTLISDNGLSDITTRDRLQSFSQHQPLLFAVAYRVLRSTADAEDLLQETFIRWQQMSEVEIESPRALLGDDSDPSLHQPSAIGASTTRRILQSMAARTSDNGSKSEPRCVI